MKIAGTSGCFRISALCTEYRNSVTKNWHLSSWEITCVLLESISLEKLRFCNKNYGRVRRFVATRFSRQFFVEFAQRVSVPNSFGKERIKLSGGVLMSKSLINLIFVLSFLKKNISCMQITNWTTRMEILFKITTRTPKFYCDTNTQGVKLYTMINHRTRCCANHVPFTLHDTLLQWTNDNAAMCYWIKDDTS